MEVINGEDLNNILGLKEKVKKVISNPNITSFDRRQGIESFMTRNWSQIKDDMIKGELGKVYCQGRIPKDKRLEMQEELFKRCEDNAIVRPTNVESESKDG